MNEHAEGLSLKEMERLGDEIAEISAHIDAATHRLLSCIRRFDASGAWAEQGALSCAYWLTWRIGLDIGAAREHVRVAKALGDLPSIDEALRLGQVSYSKVRAITRVATPDNEAVLLGWARTNTGAHLEKVCAKYRRVKRYQGVVPVDEPEYRYVRKQITSSGMVRVVAQLLPEEAQVVMKAIEAARERGSSAEVSAETSESFGGGMEDQRREAASRVDGLLWLAEAALAGEVGEGPRSSPVEVVVHVEKEELARDPEATLDDGSRIEPETTARLLCDSAVVEVVEDENGTPLDVGRRTRTIPAALKRALRLRDDGCRFPGCTHRRTDGHHIVPWSKGGATALGNLVSLCRRHHRFVHELGWRIEVCAGNEILFYNQRGALVPSVETRDAIRHDVVETIRSELADEGIDIDERTSLPRWDGHEPDYGWAVAELLRTDLDRESGEAEVSAET